MYNHRILPFYMTYPLPIGYQEENKAVRDMEYLQQLYPREARKCQKAVAKTLDRLDYEGSMIYDEYPDRWQLYKVSKNILDQMKRDGECECSEDDVPSERWERLTDLIQIVLFNEVFRRRHCTRRGYLNF